MKKNILFFFIFSFYTLSVNAVVPIKDPANQKCYSLTENTIIPGGNKDVRKELGLVRKKIKADVESMSDFLTGTEDVSQDIDLRLNFSKGREDDVAQMASALTRSFTKEEKDDFSHVCLGEETNSLGRVGKLASEMKKASPTRDILEDYAKSCKDDDEIGVVLGKGYVNAFCETISLGDNISAVEYLRKMKRAFFTDVISRKKNTGLNPSGELIHNGGQDFFEKLMGKYPHPKALEALALLKMNLHGDLCKIIKKKNGKKEKNFTPLEKEQLTREIEVLAQTLSKPMKKEARSSSDSSSTQQRTSDPSSATSSRKGSDAEDADLLESMGPGESSESSLLPSKMPNPFQKELEERLKQRN